jgi:hypothetical protein
MKIPTFKGMSTYKKKWGDDERIKEWGNMNRISSAISEIMAQYPGLEKDDLAEGIIDFIEGNLINFIAEVELPDPVALKLEWYKERRKSKEFRASEEELKEKKDLITVLRKLKEKSNGHKTEATYLFEPNGNVSRDGAQLPKLSFEPFSGLSIGKFEKEINPSDIIGKPEVINGRTVIVDEFAEQRDSDGVAAYKGHIDELIDAIFDVATIISRDKVEKVTHGYDADFGTIVRVRLRQNAKEAFESWRKLLDEIGPTYPEITLRVDWTGEDNLSDDELVDYMVEIMLKSGVGPKVSEKFDSVKAVREGRG